MKKYILLLILSFSVLQNFSQTTPWISSGATWYYKWSAIGFGGNDKIEYTHDTILYGKSCQVLKTTSDLYVGPPITLVSSSTFENYTYNNGDTVFYLVDTTFEILYNFGALPGNTWDLGVDTNSFDCSSSIVKVDSISSIIISTNPHRILYTSDSTNSSAGVSGTIIEHIGSMTYLFPTTRNCSAAVVDFNIYSFSCFSDSLESYSVVPSSECANPYHVGINEQKLIQEEILISPNPATDQLSLNWDNSDYVTLSVYNTIGELVFHKNISSRKNETINVADLNPGVYFIYLKTEAGFTTARRFIKK